jgi:Tol biopolymer transport system component
LTGLGAKLFLVLALIIAPLCRGSAQSLPPEVQATTGDWEVRTLVFTVLRPSVLHIFQQEVFVNDDLQKKPIKIAEGFTPEWNPDGTEIAFAEGRDELSEIYTIRADGSDKRQLTKARAGAVSPSWSPSGEIIAFAAAGSKREPKGIYLMNKDGSNRRYLTEGFQPHWSPDGRRLVFCRSPKDQPKKSAVWVINSDGTGASAITNGNAMSWFPRWVSNNAIVFASDRDGPSAIYRMNADGTNLEWLLYSKDSEFLSPSTSPDMKRLVVSARALSGSRGSRDAAGEQIAEFDIATSKQIRVIVDGSQPSVLWVRK